MTSRAVVARFFHACAVHEAAHVVAFGAGGITVVRCTVRKTWNGARGWTGVRSGSDADADAYVTGLLAGVIAEEQAWTVMGTAPRKIRRILRGSGAGDRKEIERIKARCKQPMQRLEAEAARLVDGNWPQILRLVVELESAGRLTGKWLR